MTRAQFAAWLNEYGRAWESRDTSAVARLFTPDASYHWTPFSEPKRGRVGIAIAWGEATSRQQDIHFRYEILAIQENLGIAHWHTTLTRASTGLPVRIDGVLAARMDPQGLCEDFREWWHGEEGGKAYV